MAASLARRAGVNLAKVRKDCGTSSGAEAAKAPRASAANARVRARTASCRCTTAAGPLLSGTLTTPPPCLHSAWHSGFVGAHP